MEELYVEATMSRSERIYAALNKLINEEKMAKSPDQFRQAAANRLAEINQKRIEIKQKQVEKATGEQEATIKKEIASLEIDLKNQLDIVIKYSEKQIREIEQENGVNEETNCNIISQHSPRIRCQKTHDRLNELYKKKK